MTEPKTTVNLKVEGGLLVLWNTAQKEYLESTVAVGRELKDHAENEPNPAEWLRAFQNDRHKRSNKFSAACLKIGGHLHAIQSFVRVVGFSVDGASSAFPAASPASLVVNAFAWLFDSFIKVSTEYDKLEEFFGWIAMRLKALSTIDKFVGQQKSDLLDECVVKLFVSCLIICRLGSEQVKHRIKTWVQQVKGNDKLQPELDSLKRADKELRVCIDIMTFRDGMETKETTRRIDANVEKLLAPNDPHERNDMLDWLSPLNSFDMHQRVKKQAGDFVTGGKWLLESKLFERWKTQEVNRIWYTGDPGAGKTVLASIIIDHLQKWAQDTSSHKKSVMISYLYLSYTWQPDLTELLGNILRQLQSDIGSHPNVLEKFRKYRQRGKHVHQPSLEDIKILLSQITEEKIVFVIVDGLDEFDDNRRPNLLQHLREIQANVKILITSRNLRQLEKLQQGFEKSKIAAHDEDMDTYIESRITNCPLLQSYPDRDKIKRQVKQKSGNMFIIVRIHMDAAAAVTTPYELEKVLEKLPSDLKGAYTNTMQRIKRHEELRKTATMSTLGWVAYAKRLMSISELQHALAIEKHPEHFGEKHLRPKDDIISDCCGLLILDLDDTVRYVHKSAREFFDAIRAEEFPDFDKRMTLACIEYLSMPSLHPILPTSKPLLLGSETSLENSFPFIRYAGECLHRHHRRVQNLQNDEALSEAVHTLLSGDDTRTLYSRLLLKLDAYDRSLGLLHDGNRGAIPRQRLRETLQPLHIAVYLGNPRVVMRLIDEKAEINALDPYGQSVLTIALKCGLDMVAGILLRCGAKIDLATRKGHVTLLYAVERGYEEVVEQIISPPTSDMLDEGLLKILGITYLIILALLQVLMTLAMRLAPQSRTSIHRAPGTSSLNTTITQSSGFDSSLEDYKRLLHYAYKGNVDGLLMLLEPSTSERIKLALVSPDSERRISDLSESEADDPQSYDYLDSDSDYDEPDSPAHLESIGSSTHTLESRSVDEGDLNVSEEANVHDLYSEDRSSQGESKGSFSKDVTESICVDDDGMPDLDVSSVHNNDLVERESGSEDENSCESLGRGSEDEVSFEDSEVGEAIHSDPTGLGKEDMSEEDECVANQETFDHSSKLDETKRAFLRSACFLAVENGRHEVLDTFLKYGVSPDLRNFQGQSLLHRATARGDYRLVKLLLERNADVNQRDKNGRTALTANADVKRNDVLKLLMQNDAKLDETQREGCHELYEAAVFGATNVVEFFLKNEISASITNNFGWTPLHGAAANGHLKCVELLLEEKANPSPISDTGLTPLDLVQSGTKHYDHILTGGKHYEAQLIQAREVSGEDRLMNKENIENLLFESGARTSEELMQEIGKQAFLYGKGGQETHPSWQHDDWWENGRRSIPWYSHKD